MTPETKAKEIMVNFITETIGMPTLSNKQAKACAIIHVNGIIDVYKDILKDDGGYPDRGYYIAQKQFWRDVLNEIENL